MSGLGRYFGRRLLLLIFVVWCVLTIIFALFKLLPGDPTTIFIDSNFSVEMIERQRALWGLNDPIWLQYLRYLGNMALFSFGDSFFQNESVAAILAEKTRNTALMIVPALIISVLLGTFLGAIAGWKRGTRLEKTTVVSALFLHSAPVFFVGILVLMVFSYELRWFPPGGMVSLGGPDDFLGIVTSADYWQHLA